MKTAFTLLIVVLTVLACGCTAVSPSKTSPVPPETPARSPGLTASLPDLTGTWTGPMQGYDERTGFTDYPDLKIALVVSEQHGRLFSGYLRFNESGNETTSEIAGAIGRDNRSLTVTEQGGGYSMGEVLSKDEIELTYMQDGTPYSIAVDSFKRV